MTAPTNRRSAPATTAEAVPAEDAPKATEYVEYFGTEQHGIEFIDERVITVADAKAGWELDIEEDLRWTKRNRAGTPRMVLRLDSIPGHVREILLEDPAFRVVQE